MIFNWTQIVKRIKKTFASKHLGPYEYWKNNYQYIFTLQLIFLRPSVFDLHTGDWIPNFKLWIRKVSIIIWTNVFDENFLPTSENFIFQNTQLNFSFSILLFYNLKRAYTIGSLRFYEPLEEYCLFTPNKFPNRPQVISTGTSCSNCLCTYRFLLYSSHNFSAASMFVRSFWPSTEWQISENI